MIDYDSLFIGGEWVRPSSADRIGLVSASTEEPLGSVPGAAEADVDRAVDAARAAFDAPDGWAAWAPARRAAAMRSLADQLEARAPDMAHRVSSQNGMPISIAGRLEGGFPVALVRYYAGLAETLPTQTCYLSTRILAPRSRYDEVLSTIAALAVKDSGLGRELGPEALAAYQQVKSIFV